MTNKRFSESRGRIPRDWFSRGLGQRTNKQKPHLFQGSGCNQKLAASVLPMCPSAQAFAADSYSDLLVFLLDINNAPFVIDSVFISLSLIKGAYH